MNYMPEILKMLGVEVGEKFKIKEFDNNPYYFDVGYVLVDCNGNDMEFQNITQILRGAIEIENTMNYDVKDVELSIGGIDGKCIDGDIVSSSKSENSSDIYGEIIFYYKDGKVITIGDCTKKELEDIKCAFIKHGGFDFISMIKNAFITDYSDVILIKFDEY